MLVARIRPGLWDAVGCWLVAYLLASGSGPWVAAELGSDETKILVVSREPGLLMRTWDGCYDTHLFPLHLFSSPMPPSTHARWHGAVVPVETHPCIVGGVTIPKPSELGNHLSCRCTSIAIQVVYVLCEQWWGGGRGGWEALSGWSRKGMS